MAFVCLEIWVKLKHSLRLSYLYNIQFFEESCEILAEMMTIWPVLVMYVLWTRQEMHPSKPSSWSSILKAFFPSFFIFLMQQFEWRRDNAVFKTKQKCIKNSHPLPVLFCHKWRDKKLSLFLHFFFDETICSNAF